MQMDVALAVVGLWMMLLTANVVNSLVCYNCDSTNEDCSGDQIRGKSFLQVDCPNADDECGMAFTIHPDTGHRRILNRTCWTMVQLRDYERRYGPELIGRLRVPSVERRGLMELVELRLRHCNRSLCNSRYPDSDQVPTLECYFCSSIDNPSCDFEGIDLKQMNDTALARCPSVGGPFHCAMTYKTRRNDSDSQQQTKKKKVVVSRTCLSATDLRNYERQLGSDLVGVDSGDSSLETHLFVCSDVSGCNWRFADDQSAVDGPETTAQIWCYECNDETSSTCSLSANNIQMKESQLVRPCPVDQSYGCVLWYKVQLETQMIAAVVRSCLSRDDANRYRTSYATLNSTTTTTTSSAVYSKEDAAQKSTYFLTMCFHSGCNIRFPAFEPEARLCFVCSQDADVDCDAEGNRLSSNQSLLRRCPDPSDLCSLSYVVRLESFGQLLRPSNVRRSCLNQRRASEYQRHSLSEAGDLVVIPGNSSDLDNHVYLCWSSKCNRRLPDELKDSAPAPALRCFTCSQQLPDEGPCGAQLAAETVATGAIVSRCVGSRAQDEKGERQRCFMSYVLAADGSQSHFNRSCVSVSEILSFKRRFGPDLIATDVGPQLRSLMFHCRDSLCNRHFPTETAKQSTIDCFICGGGGADDEDDDESRDMPSSYSSFSSSSSSSSSSECGVDGSLLSLSLLRPCSVFDRFFCAIVARYNMSSPEALLISMRRQCISQRDAAAYNTTGDRMELDERLKEAGDVVVYEERESRTIGFLKNFLFICRTSGCNADFPQLKSVVERYQAEIPIGVAGPVINEKKTNPLNDEWDQSQQQPIHGASHSLAAQRPPSFALRSHLATVAALIVASSVFGR